MIRGTTPTLKFRLSINCDDLTLLSVAFAQGGKVILEKSLDQCGLEGNTVCVTLSEEDTLLLDCNQAVEIQIRAGCGNTRLASRIIRESVGRILKDGCLE